MNAAEAQEICGEYNKRIETEPDLPLKTPEEWDFRKVTKEELPYAVQYEYLREHDYFRGEIAEWLDDESYEKTNRSHFLRGFDRLPMPLIDSLLKVCPVQFRDFLMLGRFPLFPLPWLAYADDYRSATVCELARFKGPSVRVCSLEDSQRMAGMLRGECAEISARLKEFGPESENLAGGFEETMTTIGKERLCLSVDFEHFGIEQIVKDFKAWAVKEAKNHRQMRKGRAASPPFHKLKWLSARRLTRAGLKQADAQKTVLERLKESGKRDPTDVLPRYASPGAWHDALKLAEQELNPFQ